MLWAGPRGRKGKVRAGVRLGSVGVVLTCLALPSCDLNGLVDISDSLLDPDAALLDHPGRKLAAGHYSELKIAGSSESGGYVLARREDSEDPRFAVVPFLLGSPCEYAPAIDYDRFSSRVNIELPGTVSVLVDQDESDPNMGTVRFIDYECHEVIEEVPHTALPGLLFPGIDPIGMLARSADGTLYLIDAEERTTTVAARDVDYGVVAGNFLFTMEKGEVVIRDQLLDEVDRVGSGVSFIVATGGDDLTLAYYDAGGVHAWTEKGGSTLLAEDGCQLWYAATDSVAYYAPCDSRRLALTTRSSVAFGVEGDTALVTVHGPTNATLPSLKIASGASVSSSQLLEVTVVTTTDPTSTSGELVALSLPEVEAGAETIEMTATVLADNVTFVPQHGLYYQDYHDGRGTLLDFERDEDDLITGVFPVAENVVWTPYGDPYSYRGILADYDGTVGRLLWLIRGDGNLVSEVVLGEDVPLQNFVGDYENEMVGYVSELDDEGTGVLTIVDSLGLYHIANRVVIDEVRLLDDPRGLVFLRRALSKETFELHAWLRDADLDLVIHEAVSEYIPIPWPSPGILYSVPKGGDAGLWFAKAR